VILCALKLVYEDVLWSSMYCRGECDFETDSRTFRSCDIKEICRLYMYWENTLLQLFGNSENLRDRIHAYCIVTEVSNFMSRMIGIIFPAEVMLRCFYQLVSVLACMHI
jgi:hypothetical protein